VYAALVHDGTMVARMQTEHTKAQISAIRELAEVRTARSDSQAVQISVVNKCSNLESLLKSLIPSYGGGFGGHLLSWMK
jgi:hypothetical protein